MFAPVIAPTTDLPARYLPDEVLYSPNKEDRALAAFQLADDFEERGRPLEAELLRAHFLPERIIRKLYDKSASHLQWKLDNKVRKNFKENNKALWKAIGMDRFDLSIQSGLVRGISIDIQAFLEHGAELLAAEPTLGCVILESSNSRSKEERLRLMDDFTQSESLSGLSGLYLTKKLWMKREHIEAFSKLSKLRELTLCGPKVKDSILEPLETLPATHQVEGASPLPNLAYLSLSDVRIRDDRLIALLRGRNLQDLSIYSTIITDKGLRGLEEMDALRKLRLKAFSLTDKGLKSISGLRGLEHLDISDLPHISDKGLRNISSLHGLKHLDVSNLPQITDRGLGNLSNLHNLEFLDLDDNEDLTDSGFEHLLGLERLQSVRCAFTDTSFESLEVRSMDHIRRRLRQGSWRNSIQ